MKPAARPDPRLAHLTGGVGGANSQDLVLVQCGWQRRKVFSKEGFQNILLFLLFGKIIELTFNFFLYV